MTHTNKTFEQYASQTPLIPVLHGSKGHLYTQRESSMEDKVMIRYFNQRIPEEFIPAFIDLTQHVGKWLENHPDLHEKITLHPFLEWGEDYTVRKFELASSLSSIKGNSKLKNPVSLGLLRQRIRELFETDDLPEVAKQVIAKSFLQAGTKTYYDWRDDTFVIAELSVNEHDLNIWREMMTA